MDGQARKCLYTKFYSNKTKFYSNKTIMKQIKKKRTLRTKIERLTKNK